MVINFLKQKNMIAIPRTGSTDPCVVKFSGGDSPVLENQF